MGGLNYTHMLSAVSLIHIGECFIVVSPPIGAYLFLKSVVLVLLLLTIKYEGHRFDL